MAPHTGTDTRDVVVVPQLPRAGVHRLYVDTEPVPSAAAGADRHIGSCSCGDLVTTPVAVDTVLDAYLRHLMEVEAAVRRSEALDADPSAAVWRLARPVGTQRPSASTLLRRVS